MRSSSPAEILFGVGTSDHQCEAHVPDRPEWADSWDLWEDRMRLTPRGSATEFWCRYQEDIEHARQMGCTAFRFSIAWARVQRPDGTFDQEALDHYEAVARACAEAGMEPVVTLVHGVWPTWVNPTDAGFPDAFAAYARQVARRLGRHVRWWLTFNEPNMCVFGYLKPWWMGEYRMPPGLPAEASPEEQTRLVELLMRNLFTAHARARSGIQAERRDAAVSANAFLFGLPSWVQRLLDWRVGRLRRQHGLIREVRRMGRRPLTGRGRADLVAATLSITPRRGEHVDFSRPYRVATLRLLVAADHPAASTTQSLQEVAEALDRAQVAVVRGTTAGAAMRALPGSRQRPVDSYREALAELAGGRVDAVLADDAILSALMQREPDRWAMLRCGLGHERYAVAVTKGDGDLLALVNQVIDDMTSPPSGGSATPRAGPAGRPRRRRLVAGVRPDVPGLGFRDPTTGEWSGQEIDLVHEIARRAGGDGARATLRPATGRARLRLLRPWWDRLTRPLGLPLDMMLCALNGSWWHLGMSGRLPTWLCPPEARHAQDFVAFDYYYGIPNLGLGQLRRVLRAATGDYAGAPVWPAALRRTLRYLAGLAPGLQVMVVENGCVPVVGGMPRSEYLREHVEQVRLAVDDGVPVAGYLCWSITSNREWGKPFGPDNDFGLYRVDLDGDPSLVRVGTGDEEAYRELIEEMRGPAPPPLPRAVDAPAPVAAGAAASPAELPREVLVSHGPGRDLGP